MAPDELIDEVAKLRGWRVLANGKIRRQGRHSECPIKAWANRHRTVRYATDEWAEAAVVCGLSASDAGALVDAADRHRDPAEPEKVIALRRRMLAAFGINEVLR